MVIAQVACVQLLIWGGSNVPVTNLNWLGPAVHLFSPTNTGTNYIGFYFLEKFGIDYGYAPIFIDDVLLEDVTIVPVTGGKLSAAKVGAGYKLFFQTYSETNNRDFEIQESADGIVFNAIGTVASKATNGNSILPIGYEYTIPNNTARFFRYKQTDRDGKFAYSNIVAIKELLPPTTLKIITNPVTNSLQASVYSNTTQPALFKITDANGRLLWQKHLILSAGYNSSVVDVSTLTTGVYFISITDKNNIPLQNPVRFVKQ